VSEKIDFLNFSVLGEDRRHLFLKFFFPDFSVVFYCQYPEL
jgi:hypothetical protein